MKLKSLLALTLAVMMTLVFTACEKEAEETTEIANPVHECTQDEMLDATGINLDAPADAADVAYTYIEGVEDEAAVAQVEFTLDGHSFCYRAQMTDITDLAGLGIDEQIDVTTALSGLYEDWKTAAAYIVADRDAIIAFNEGSSGYIAWLDVVPGVMYSLSVDNGATQTLLAETAEAIFVPLQGEV